MKTSNGGGMGWAALVAVVAMAAGWPVQAATVYVSPSGNDGGDGRSWATAKKTVQAGLNAAASGDQVWVAAGTYVQCITLKAGVGLYGGFAGGETELSQRNWTTNVTILDGNQTGSVVTAPSGVATNTRIDGFTIRNGKPSFGSGGISCYTPITIANNTITGNSGSGIFCLGNYTASTIINNTITNNAGGIYCTESSSPTITGNTITGNIASKGGGVYCDKSASPVIANNTITGNSATGGSGGGIYCSSSSPTITGNVISGNSAYASGGGIYCSSSSSTIAGNMVAENTAVEGGGVYYVSSSPTIINNMITANETTSGNGGGIYCKSSTSSTITNCTIAGNSADKGGGIYCDLNTWPNITNTIVAFNSSGIHQVNNTSPGRLQHNCVYANTAYNYYLVLPDPTGTYGNISVDPRMAGAGYGNYHIQLDSPCVDAGDDSIVQAGWVDSDGQARTQGAHVDIGADESDGTTWPQGPSRIIRVSPAGDDANDGSSWGLAKRTVQAGIDSGAATGADVWVAAGTYLERITLRKRVHLYGGFAGTEALRSGRDIAANASVLDGNQAGTVVTGTALGCGLSTIDGFTIRNGKGTTCGGVYCASSPTIANNTIISNKTTTGSGGGIYCATGSATITGNTITGNSAAGAGGISCGNAWVANNVITGNNGGSGGGIVCVSSATIINNTITGNTVVGNPAEGGGIFCPSGSPTIRNNTISSNTASTRGGGICSQVSSPTITGNTILGNSSSSGGGIYCRGSSLPITNNTITRNVASAYGGGIFCDSDSAPLITNNTITGNSASLSGGGIFFQSGYTPTITNNTIAGNSAPDGGGIYSSNTYCLTIINTIVAFNASGIYKTGSGTAVLQSNCVYGSAGYNYAGLADPTGTDGNICVDPKLAQLLYVNVHIQPDSPCIDAGENGAVQASWLDMDGQGRKQGAGVDIGADESDGTVWPSGPSVIVRVSPQGNDANDGSSWGLAKQTVQAGIQAAAPSGGQVWVAAGTYVERITLAMGVGLYGGFAGNETDLSQRDWIANLTTLDGSKGGSTVTVAPGAMQATRIDGFTIRNGKGSPNGGGIYCASASPTIIHNTITGNATATYGSGGGIYCTFSTAAISDNTITANTADRDGNGIYCASGSSAQITNNTFTSNGIYCSSSFPTIANNTMTVSTIYCSSSSATITNNAISGSGSVGITCSSSSPSITNNRITGHTGGGIYCSSSSPTIANNVITGNGGSGYYGGAIYCWSSSPTITNNILSGNKTVRDSGYGGGIYCGSTSNAVIADNTLTGNSASLGGGGIYCASSSPTIQNNTIAGNIAPAGGGIYCTASSPTVVNTIVAFNSSGVYVTGSGTPSLRYNCVYANGSYGFSGLADPTGTNGNIAVDPRLAQPFYVNVHIQPDSPCIDAGDDSVVQADWQDMDGQGRNQGRHVDIGADESDGTLWPSGSSVIVRVSPQGNDANDGTSWALAKRTVQAGISAAAAAGGQVWVAAGTYVETITLAMGVGVYGGFAGAETHLAERNWGTNITILDGNQKATVVSAGLGIGQTARIDGFTIRNGLAYTGGGIYCSYASPTIANNTITGNRVWGSSCGAGIYCSFSSATITNNVIVNNSLLGSDVCSGGGIYCGSSSPTITSNTIARNSASMGGGIYCSSSSPTIANNAIVCNAAPSGGGIYCTSSSSPIITNNTLAANSAATGGAIFCNGSSCPTIANTIIASNSSGIYTTGAGILSLRYSCVYGNGAYNYSGLADPTGTNGNISADPRLAAMAYGNIHIQPDSPCLDAGDDSAIQTGWADMDGQGRQQGTRVDIGADESNGTVWPDGPNIVVRVALDGSDANDGSSWALAKRTIQAGIEAAAGSGGEVWVKTGTYQGSMISLRNCAHVYGGFAGIEGNRAGRDCAHNETVLDASFAGIGVVASGVGYGVSTLDGFTIRNGGSCGEGIQCGVGSPTISNNKITANTNPSGYGGIYCMSGASPVIVRNTISANKTGIYCTGSYPTITNNAILANDIGIYCTGAGSATIANNTISGNTSSGIYCQGGSPMIAGNTVTGNTGSSGGAIYCCYGSSPTIVNTIIAFNSSGIYVSGGTPSIRYTCVYGNTVYNYSGLTDPTGANGNIAVDPRLAYPPYANVHIQPDSPCLDAGDDSAIQAGWTDIDGQPRAQGTHVDIGADESDGTVWPSGTGIIVRVSPQGDDTNDGSSWAQSKRTVQAAINEAAPAGGQVWVAAGTYVQNLVLPLAVSLFGGFSGSETDLSQRNWITSQTILDGGGAAASVIVVSSGLTPAERIDGFIIRNGNVASQHTAGIYCAHASPTIANNTITGNVCPGITCEQSSSPIITNNVIRGNNGAGISCSSSSPTIMNNQIAGNATGGIVCSSSSSPTITNNTIAGNGGTYGGVYCSTGSPTITNTIVAFNSLGIYVAGGTPSLRCNCVYGNAANNYSGVADPTGTNGNVSIDPRLANPLYGNRHLQPDSPCIDAGDDSVMQAGWTDTDGQPRKQGARVDIGADESDGTVWPSGPSLVVRVSPQGDDANDGSSWALAKRTVQGGIEAAAAAGGEVWVAAGTYIERITLRDYAYVYGGFAGTEADRSERNWTRNATVLDGSQAGSVVTARGLGYGLSTVDGFVIRNGKSTSSSGGIYCTMASPTIANNTITSNVGPGISASAACPRITCNRVIGNGGYGITCSSGSLTIISNTISGNADAGICCDSSSVLATIVSNTIAGNAGSGIYCMSASSITVLGNTIVGNTATSGGGGIYCSSPTATISNNTMAGNTTKSSGGGIFCISSSPTIANNTIVGNIAATNGGGIYCSSATITNTIIAFNSSGVYKTGTTTPTLRYNCVYGNTAYNYSGLTDPTGTNGNLRADPRFVRAASAGADGTWGTADDDYGDLRLLPGSGCIDAGSNADVPADGADLDGDGNTTEALPFDLAGTGRFLDDAATADTGAGTAPIVDIGAYEYLCGDVSGDGHVDAMDLLSLAASWAKGSGQSGFNPACDFSHDGSVDVVDLLYLAGSWGR